MSGEASEGKQYRLLMGSLASQGQGTGKSRPASTAVQSKGKIASVWLGITLKINKLEQKQKVHFFKTKCIFSPSGCAMLTGKLHSNKFIFHINTQHQNQKQHQTAALIELRAKNRNAFIIKVNRKYISSFLKCAHLAPEVASLFKSPGDHMLPIMSNGKKCELGMT